MTTRKAEKFKENPSIPASTIPNTITYPDANDGSTAGPSNSVGVHEEIELLNPNTVPSLDASIRPPLDSSIITDLYEEIEKLKKANEKIVKQHADDKRSIAFYDTALVVSALFFTSFVGMLSSVGSVPSATGWNDVQGEELKRALQRLAFSCVTVLWSLTIMLGRRLNLSTNIKRKDQDQNDDFRDYIHKILTLISRFSLVVGVCLFGHALVILQLNVAGWTFIGVALFSFFHRLLDLYLISGKFFQSLIVFIELEPEKITSN